MFSDRLRNKLFLMIGQYLVKTAAESVVAGIAPVGFPRNHVLYFDHFSSVFASCALPCWGLRESGLLDTWENMTNKQSWYGASYTGRMSSTVSWVFSWKGAAKLCLFTMLFIKQFQPATDWASFVNVCFREYCFIELAKIFPSMHCWFKSLN